MTGLIMAWLTGEGLMTYRSVQQNHRPPLPADLLTTSGLFVVLALLAEWQAHIAALLAWGFVSAAFLHLWPTPSAKTKSKTKTN